MRDHSRDYYDDKYIDGRYPSVKAPARDLWDDEYWDDDEDTLERNDEIEVRGGDDVVDAYDLHGRTAHRHPIDLRDDRPRDRIEVRGGDDPEDYYDDEPRETDESSWEMNRYLRSLPARETTKRSVRSDEQAPAFDDSARAWRTDPKTREIEEPTYEEPLLEDGPRMPLTITLLVMTVILTIAGGVGRLHGYQNLDYDWRRAPLLSLVFSGWHDHISPIAALTQDPADETTAAENDEVPQDDAATESSDTDGSGTDAAAENPAMETTEQEPAEVDLNIPDGVNDPVVQAADYGVCNSAYLASADTTFEPLTEGIFAPNGTYLEPQTVDATYLNNALLIGDSRTDGLHLYGDVRNDAYFWCKEALSVYDIYDTEAVYYVPGESDGTSMTLEEALGQSTFRKIYVSIGINELGTPDTERFYTEYKNLISYIRERQPDALIYIQGIMHVSASYSQSDAAFNNTNIVDKNTAIASLANGRDIFYLDLNGLVCDENGDLLDDVSNDGLHLKASVYAVWKQSLLDHAFVRDADDWTVPETAVNADGTAAGGTTGQGTGKPESDISDTTGLIVQ